MKLSVLIMRQPMLKSSLPEDHIPRKKAPIWELFFVLNMAIGRGFGRINSELILLFFSYFWMINAKIKLLCLDLFFHSNEQM